MVSGLKHYSGAIVCIACMAIMAGCNGSISPFLAAQFNNTLIPVQGNLGAPPVVNPPNDNDNTADPDVLGSVCDLPVGQRSIEIAVQNESNRAVDFSITLVVSAGPGGFVCDAELQEYLDAGYRDAIVPGSGNNANIGCDVINLVSGSRILTLEFGINQGAAARVPGNANANLLFPDPSLPSVQLRRVDNGGTDLPLPEVIVLGNNDPDFVCTGNDLCSQRGFVYVTNAGIPVGRAAEADRIQGTICAENFGTAPEWRLDRTFDNTSQPFQFGRGGAIIVGVLDREDDPLSSTRNQVAWLVTDENDATIQTPQR